MKNSWEPRSTESAGSPGAAAAVPGDVGGSAGEPGADSPDIHSAGSSPEGFEAGSGPGGHNADGGAAGEDSAPASDGGADGSTDCNGLIQQGSPVVIENNPEALEATGKQGKLSAGVYVLTRDEWFVDSRVGTIAATLSVEVHGSIATLQGVVALDHSARFNGTLTPGDPLTSAFSCKDTAFDDPAIFPVPMPSGYTATSDALVLIFADDRGAGYRLTFTKT